ncbi:acetate non-utilizing protein, partial [Wallemia mellicola CBS 633.66]
VTMATQYVKELLPPIKLYRRLLRIHRTLPKDFRLMGDGYLRDEFRRHQNIDNPLQIIGFLSSWKIYLDQMQNPSMKQKMNLDDLLTKLSHEQVSQLYELLNEIKKL